MQHAQLSTLEKLTICIEKLGASGIGDQIGYSNRTVRHWRQRQDIPAHSAHESINTLYELITELSELYDLEDFDNGR